MYIVDVEQHVCTYELMHMNVCTYNTYIYIYIYMYMYMCIDVIVYVMHSQPFSKAFRQSGYWKSKLLRYPCFRRFRIQNPEPKPWQGSRMAWKS